MGEGAEENTLDEKKILKKKYYLFSAIFGDCLHLGSSKERRRCALPVGSF